MLEQEDNNQQSSKYSLKVECASALNFVLQQNSVPLIKQILISSPNTTIDSKIIFKSNPESFKEHTIFLSHLDPEKILSIDSPKLSFDVTFLRELPENLKGNIEVSWLSKSGEILAFENIEIDLLTIDTWGGEKQPIELLASFSQPNAPSLNPILVAASEWLNSKQLGSLSGYLERDRISVRTQVNALWEALLLQEIHYIVNPASFIKYGQRIRFAKQILDEKLGCCLDLTLLLSSLAEQIGLDTLLILEEGHAYLGVWLNETPSADLIIDDIQSLRKRYDLGELIFVETTLLTKKTKFSQALETAQSYIKDELRQGKFSLALDVRQARLRGVKPISLKQEKIAVLDESENEWAPASVPDFHSENLVENKTTRVDRWLRRLLDLSLRNKLLNFKDNRLSIPLQSSEIILSKLEDALANQEGFLFKSTESIALKEVQRENEKNYIDHYVDECLARKILFSPLESSVLEKRLIEVYRASKTALEEGGANTLFLAVGFLEWKESERSKRIFKAPLLLIPVQITRETAKTGYKLFMYDDEPRFNSTLLQLLRQDFDLDILGLNPLPTDDAGVDVNQILHIIRKAVVSIPGWEVKTEAAIGQFSFSKYLMWLDLSTRMDQLKNQSVVNHLIESPRDPYLKQDDFPKPVRLDQDYKPQQLFTPLSSDSSQLAAVMSAALGRTFVLSGPPGTGKSQTITNMIAQCLADGKSVLFVSEKMAALEVVYRRLSQIGLSELCLQLHSSKAQKMAVLDQLRERALKTNDPYLLETINKKSKWQSLSNQLVQTRDELNHYVNSLHTSHQIGWSLYSAMSDELCYRTTPKLRFSSIDISTLTAERRKYLKELVIQAVTLRQLVSVETKKDLEGFAEGISDNIWSLSWQDQYQKLQDDLEIQINNLNKIISPWQEIFGQNAKVKFTQVKQDFDLFYSVYQLVKEEDLKLLFNIKDISLNLLTESQILASDLKQQRSQLIGQYQDSIFQAEISQVVKDWREAESSIFPFSWFAKSKIKKLIKTYQINDTKLTSHDMLNELQRLQHIQDQQLAFSKNEEQLSDKLSTYWLGEVSPWEKFENAHHKWQQILQTEGLSHSDKKALFTSLAYCQKNNIEDLMNQISLSEATIQYLVRDTTLLDKSETQTYLDVRFEDLIKRQKQLQQHSGAWRNWINWQNAKEKLIVEGLKPLADVLSEKPLVLDEAVQQLEINLARQWITNQFNQYPELNQFNSQLHEKKIEQFKQQDKEHQKEASQEIIYRWNEIFKNPDKYKSQWSLLNKELGKKRRHIPVRELMRQIPDVLVGLKPCLLMSPLSVAQYLDTEAKFDVVIFDEASQIPVWDAIGALARGKQSIVVGDNKQMPPTSFFGKGDSDEEVDEEITEDLESILDECLAAQLPELALNWHYRSRYESLIQFSNQKYYKGELMTFPAPVADDTAITLHKIDGVYDKGDTRTNLAEAKAIVAFILQHLQSQLSVDVPLTLGVVTFNVTQQKLIEDLLDNEMANYPELESISKSGIEPLFIKNLENVQGDERDIIVFSITYAKDQFGKLSMNFGALNRVGGQRRLNVAITRARQGLHVFSSLAPEDINLTRTNSEGVKDLKDFLLFARSKQLHLAYSSISKAPTKKELILYLQNELHNHGWKTDIEIGSGENCVDIAVYDQLNPEAFVVGILIDGENYANTATASDRDHLRQLVLTGLGWEIISIWTVDWWLDPERNLNDLIKKIRELSKIDEV